MTTEKSKGNLKYKQENFWKYLNFVGSIIIILDLEGKVIFINQKGCEVLGYNESEIIGKNWVQNFLPEEIKDSIEKTRIEVINSATEGRQYYENPVVIKSGEQKIIRWSNTVLKDNEGKLTGTLSSGEDITDMKMREQEIENSKLQLLKAEEIAEMGSWIMDIKTGKYICSDGFLKICGFDKADFGSDYDSAMGVTHPEDIERIEKIISDSMRLGIDYEFENRIVRPNGEIRHVRSKGTYIKDTDGRAIKSIGTLLDITDMKNQYDEIKHMYNHDFLTGLNNRRYFDEEFEKMDVIGNYPISVITADINGLKMVNDTEGHAAGDRILVKVADILKSICEKDDLLARTGGDDFILLLPRTVRSQAELVMNDLHLLFLEYEGGDDLAVSMGLAVKINGETSKEEIIKEAEDSMYTSKLYEKTSKRGDMLQLIMDALYERSNREKMHSERVSDYCKQLASALRLPQHKINELSALGLLHDIGKIAVRDSVLNKPGRLDEDEWEEIKRHPATGYRIIKNVPGMQEASKYILAHHEKWDGSGYPNGICSYEIPLQARIIAIGDAYDAMMSKRPYRDPLPIEVVISEIKKGAGTQFDPDLAKVFVIQVLGEKW